MKLPCINCITLGICKHKDFDDLIEDCNIVNNYLTNYKDPEVHKARARALVDYLKPTKWYLGTGDKDGYDINYYANEDEEV